MCRIQSVLWILVIFLKLVMPTAAQTSACPLENDPSLLLNCIQLDVSSLLSLVQGSSDLTGFCSLASRYLECFSTYTRGCVGQYVRKYLKIFK